MGKEWNQDDWEKRLGANDDISIYTGVINGVRAYHIKCTYNAYQGYSGGPVFAADERYPEYRRKAIAIHL